MEQNKNGIKDVVIYIRFRGQSPIRNALEERVGLMADHDFTKVVRRDLGRYYSMLKAEVATIQLSAQEWEALIATINPLAVTTPMELPGMVEEAERMSGAFTQLGVDAQALIEKFRNFSPAQLFVVLDAIERAARRSAVEA